MQHRFKSKLDTPNHVCAGLFKPRAHALLPRPSLHPQMADTNSIQNADQPIMTEIQCPLCFEAITDSQKDVFRQSVTSSCAHVFHYDCLTLFMSGMPPECPECPAFMGLNSVSPNNDQKSDTDTEDQEESDNDKLSRHEQNATLKFLRWVIWLRNRPASTS